MTLERSMTIAFRGGNGSAPRAAPAVSCSPLFYDIGDLDDVRAADVIDGQRLGEEAA